MLSVLVCIIIACAIAYPVTADVPLTGWMPGRSTYYTTPDNGECGYGTLSTSTFPYRKIGAANTAFFAAASACGACYEIQCTSSPYLSNACHDGSVIIQISDECPAQGNAQWCSGDITHFDLSTNAFNTIANSVAGVIYTNFRQVTCDVSGGLQYVIKDGVNAWWLAILVKNVGGHGAISNVEIAYGGSGFMSMARQSYNYWLIQAGGNGVSTPASLRVTSTSRAQIVDTNIINYITAGSTFYSKQNFADNSYYVATAEHPAESVLSPDDTKSNSFPTLFATSNAIGLAAGIVVVALIVGVAVGAGVTMFIVKRRNIKTPLALYDYQPVH
jgi:expansin (peptidoglycan-binding protein)